MKVSTPTQTVVENAAKRATVLHTWFAPLLAAVRQKPRQKVAKEKRTKAPRVGRPEPQRPSSCVMLVESDIKKDLHGIVP